MLFNPHFPALWSGPIALSGASRRKQTPSSPSHEPHDLVSTNEASEKHPANPVQAAVGIHRGFFCDMLDCFIALDLPLKKAIAGLSPRNCRKRRRARDGDSAVRGRDRTMERNAVSGL